jgi:hypothetical protein
MKNIFIIPTNKPSRLAKHSSGSFHIVSYIAHKKGLYKMTNQHIYITSDEEIKEVDWVIECSLNWVFKMHKHGLPNYNPNKKKIILTTDPDLIKDGVQAINDKFLEWFVKNSSCEFVEFKRRYSDFTVDPFVGYEIFIPQEEFTIIKGGNDIVFPSSTTITFKPLPDVNWESDITNKVWDEDEPKQIKCYCGHTITCDCEPLQETLEEVEENIDREEWINFFKNNSKEEILEYLINYKFPL